MILRLPSLKYSSLSLFEEKVVNVFVPLAINERCSALEYLFMNHNCTLNELISILSHTPRLRRLVCDNLVESYTNVKNEVSVTLPNLTHFSVDGCEIKFDEFEKFIKQICSQLQVLCVRKFFNEDYIDPDQWKQLILQNMPHLLKLTIKCPINIDDSFNNNHFDSFVHQFSSPFWIEREWVFELEIQSEEIFYSIYSNKYYQKCFLFLAHKHFVYLGENCSALTKMWKSQHILIKISVTIRVNIVLVLLDKRLPILPFSFVHLFTCLS